MFHSTLAAMKDDIRDHRWMFGAALPVSLVLHSALAAFIIFDLSISLPQPKEEQAIAVDLVPPEPPEQAEAEPPPPAEEPKSEKPPEPEVETPPARNDAGRQASLPALRPVFQFGETDMGPREAPRGNSAEDGSAAPTARHDPDKQDLAEPQALAAAEPSNEGRQPRASETPAVEPADTAKAQESEEELQEATVLFSQRATGDPTSATAMDDVPRDVRAGRLCVTELREQLLHALPPYFPELLPSHRLEDGTVIEITRTAFRASRQWYNLSYRCAVDPDVTKVIAFAFQVGEPVPRSEWQRRGLPSE
ncbi:hypothetical protein ATN84_07955 [Paramesorhizobium deserti]|uniref:DUF930 domain-containing protein n=1 Tax=Paramesorhizobium deserti TaxID=1494590 RepID=A0A135HVU2_9HYPH|nr:DUF930 domain-containing protein [Paramesorhizobium deserti]KXF77319.1 hypothetical protein ATN84_07955 [Paramesorhizobium deserti]